MEIVKKREEERQIEKLQKTALGRFLFSSHRKRRPGPGPPCCRNKGSDPGPGEAHEGKAETKAKGRIRLTTKEQELEAAEVDSKARPGTKAGYLGVDMSEWVAAKPDDRPSELRGSKHGVQFTFTGTTGRGLPNPLDANGEVDEAPAEPAKRKVLPHLVELTNSDLQQESKRVKLDGDAATEWRKRREELAKKRQSGELLA